MIRNRTNQLTLILGAVAAAAVLLSLLWLANWSGQRFDAERAAREESDAKVAALDAQVRSLGEKPVVTPDPDVDPEPVTVTEGQVRAIVAEELLDRDITLTPAQVDRVAAEAARRIPKPKDGTPGKPGLTPTPEQVRAVVQQVVADVCANDACRGEDGEDSTVPGPQGDQGPPPTDGQMDAAFARYCSARPSGTCEGERGPVGDQGPPGRGIQSGPDFVRADDGSCVARTTYDDGTVYESPAGDAACPPAPLIGN